VVSDYGAVNDLIGRHGVAASKREAARRAFSAGVDVETPDPDCFPLLKDLVQSGELPAALLDSAVARVLRQKFALGLFENPYADEAKALRTVGAPENRDLARRAAEEAIVLLKNEDNLAPVDPARYKTIAVIGPNADRTLLGGYSDEPRYFVNVLEGIRKKVGNRSKVLYSKGCGITEPCSWYKDPVKPSDPDKDRLDLRGAVETARTADLIVLAIGGNECESREAWADNHLGDHPDMELAGLQNELFDALHALGKPVVVLLLNGRPYSIPNIAAKASAIFECWYLGQECGNAVANVLFGDVNPSGKLPITFPRSAGHLPVFYNHKPSARRGYLFGDVSPLYPFGYGLSYTSFEVGAPVLSKNVMAATESVKVNVTLRNTGNRAGKETVQCYVRDLYASVTRPVKELKAFQKIELQPGETKTVEFTLTPDDFSMYDYNMQYGVEPGDFEIMTGVSSRDEDLKKTFLKINAK
jgi:beta-glucosidase